ncbi:MAG: hypothetical protein FWG29_05620 [Treponema sp.]|nr:hypothetical protein [Treponema sp.]
MIKKTSAGRYAIKCAHCGVFSKQTFDSFQAAVDSKKAAGCITIKDNAGKYHELCPSCGKNESIVKAIKEGWETSGW